MSGGRSRGSDPSTSDIDYSTSPLPNFTVDHDPAKREFYIKIGNDKAFIQYNKVGDLMRLEHTEVPDTFSGRGVGKILAKVFINSYI